MSYQVICQCGAPPHSVVFNPAGGLWWVDTRRGCIFIDPYSTVRKVPEPHLPRDVRRKLVAARLAGEVVILPPELLHALDEAVTQEVF